MLWRDTTITLNEILLQNIRMMARISTKTQQNRVMRMQKENMNKRTRVVLRRHRREIVIGRKGATKKKRRKKRRASAARRLPIALSRGVVAVLTIQPLLRNPKALSEIPTNTKKFKNYKAFKSQVATHVRKCMKEYYQRGYVSGREEYRQLAQKFTNQVLDAQAAKLEKQYQKSLEKYQQQLDEYKQQKQDGNTSEVTKPREPDIPSMRYSEETTAHRIESFVHKWFEKRKKARSSTASNENNGRSASSGTVPNEVGNTSSGGQTSGAPVTPENAGEGSAALYDTIAQQSGEFAQSTVKESSGSVASDFAIPAGYSVVKREIVSQSSLQSFQPQSYSQAQQYRHYEDQHQRSNSRNGRYGRSRSPERRRRDRSPRRNRDRSRSRERERSRNDRYYVRRRDEEDSYSFDRRDPQYGSRRWSPANVRARSPDRGRVYNAGSEERRKEPAGKRRSTGSNEQQVRGTNGSKRDRSGSVDSFGRSVSKASRTEQNAEAQSRREREQVAEQPIGEVVDASQDVEDIKAQAYHEEEKGEDSYDPFLVAACEDSDRTREKGAAEEAWVPPLDYGDDG
eukprot:gb/GECG01002509.1/.p1 GENE.gb/GECG01002509.1/~~gb/GECG01002509.1/.p1  ORF type:complete len:569 (+),score=91.51 gb/GECG01002509.1/:1-1707(+)